MTRTLLALLCAGTLAACSSAAKSPDVSSSIRSSLDANGLKDVSVSQDRDKGIVTLGGHVAADADKTQAETLAKNAAPTQVVADQIIVTPPGNESDARTISSALDAGIEKNLKAALLEQHVDDGVSYSVKAAVVTVSGTVVSEATRTKVAMIASEVPNVKQVINELRVKRQNASSSGIR
jgi:osmotically-inducible protein OsmY